MLTVIVSFVGSGKRSTLKPFDVSRYSVMPSTEVTRSTPCGVAALALAGACMVTAGNNAPGEYAAANTSASKPCRNIVPGRLMSALRSIASMEWCTAET